MSKRITFTFDKKSLEHLNDLRERMGFASIAEAVRESLSVYLTLLNQAERDGFSEIILRNPETEDEVKLVIPSMRNRQATAKAKEMQ